eukprot:3293685-Amphidinium_carterae.4
MAVVALQLAGVAMLWFSPRLGQAGKANPYMHVPLSLASVLTQAAAQEVTKYCLAAYCHATSPPPVDHCFQYLKQDGMFP